LNDEDAASLVAISVDGGAELMIRESIDRLAWARVGPAGRLALAVRPMPPALWLSDRYR
jgi:hypothetical protein